MTWCWRPAAPWSGTSTRHPRVEVELAFVLKKDLAGPGCTIFDVLNATDYVVPALEILDSRIEMEGRTIVDTISDNAAMGAMVIGGNPVRPDAVDLRWVSAILYKNQTVEETGVAAGVLDHPANGVHWLANKIAAHGDGMKAGDIILAGSFTRPALGVQGRHRPRRLRTPGGCHMPLRVEPTPRSGTPCATNRRCRPPAGRDVGLLRQPPGGRTLRRLRPGLAAGRRRAQPQRARIHPGPAAGRSTATRSRFWSGRRSTTPW